MPTFTFRGLAVFSVASVAVCVLLMSLRIYYAVSFSEPLQLFTSGWEQEALFPIWKAIYGRVVFPDQYLIPFSQTVYNWLFIESYALLTAPVLALLSLGDAWIPTIGRFITLALLVVGTALCYASYVAVLATSDRLLKVLCLSFSVFLFFGPLMGFWGFTVRPDVGSLVFEILVIYLFWKLYPERPVTAVVLCAVAAYAAWGFKQVNVVSTLTIGLYMLYRRDWKSIFILAAVLAAAYALTFLVGGTLYFKAFVDSSRKGFSLVQFLANFKIFIVKSGPVLAPLAALVALAASSPGFRRAVAGDARAKLVLSGLGVGAVVNLLASFKIGAADHYYLVLTYFIAFACLTGYALIREGAADGGGKVSVGTVVNLSMLGWAANIAAVAAVLLGLRGVVSVVDYPNSGHAMYKAVMRCAATLPKPVFIDTPYLELPWMNPDPPHFVIAFKYFEDRAAGFEFESNGIGGLIEEGFFGSLLLYGRQGEAYDGGRLDGYRAQAECYPNWLPYVRRQGTGG